MAQYDNILSKLESYSCWSPQKEATLLEPYTYITSNPGKDIRGRLIEAFNLWLEVPTPKLAVISRLVSMLHSASLLVDDIEDNSQLRRGQPVAHKIYGVPQTINTANYVFFLAYQELFRLRDQDSFESGRDQKLDVIVNEELLSLHRGQGLEIFWRDSLQCPTEDEYLSMVNNKTGGLLRIGIKLMMACSTNNVDVDYVPLVNLIGIYFQIRDDLMNLLGTEYTKNKGFAEDLTEGKFSFPVVHSINADETNRQVLNVLQKRPTSPTLKNHTIEYMRTHTKSFEYTFAVLETLEAQMRKEIQRLGGNTKLQGVVDSLSVQLIRKEEA
ncbi:Geranylgeranyl pyrophosphate synthase [Termitomyces sp. T112]|nr:Geranylgeranyl pyrophosphate synthase [Termitomyces sp. T112]KAH0588361.1 hypothetical protein H2248_004217 [Termitomyces sp. 'cryptogamus']